MSRQQMASQWLVRMGGVSLLDTYWGNRRLTVLAYHRVIEFERDDFADYLAVVSTSPTMFEQQLAFVRDHFNVISLWDLRAALTEGAALPDHPLLITFDDGYLDNYENAYPLLKKFGFPAVIFLTTSRMDDPTPLWWDAVARCFHHTKKTEADLPLLGHTVIEKSKRGLLDDLLRELKKVPEDEKLAAVEAIRAALDVTDPDETPVFMNWAQVREVIANGIACQGHTITHPIMTRVSLAEQRRQLTESRDRIQAETGQQVIAFAYPNGTAADYSPETMALLREAGYEIAFTLAPGPMRWSRVQAHPLQIRRVYLGYRDTYEMFALKVMGITAIYDDEPLAYPKAQD